MLSKLQWPERCGAQINLSPEAYRLGEVQIEVHIHNIVIGAYYWADAVKSDVLGTQTVVSMTRFPGVKCLLCNKGLTSTTDRSGSLCLETCSRERGRSCLYSAADHVRQTGNLPGDSKRLDAQSVSLHHLLLL